MNKFWNERKVFISGASGLVGTSLTMRLIELGAEVVVLLRDQDPQSELIRSEAIRYVNVVSGALENYYDLERALSAYEIDTVFHLGAQAIVPVAYRSPLQTFETNIRGTYNLLEACRVHCAFVKRIVIASSDKAYGDGESLPYKEAMAPLGKFPYDVSKSCTDLLSQSYFHTYRSPIAIARCGNIYGRGDLNWSRLIPGTIRSLLENQSPIIRSDGKFTRDYIYVNDVVSAYLCLAENLDRKEVQGEAFNFAPGKAASVLEVVKSIQKVMGKENITPDIRNEAKAEIRDQYLDATKANTILQWQPQFTLEQGLKPTIAWYESFLSAKKDRNFKL